MGKNYQFKAVPRIYGNSLTLEGNIGINTYLILDDYIAKDPNAYVKIAFKNKSETHKISELQQMAVDGQSMYRVSYYVSAPEVQDKISIQVYNGDGELQWLQNSNSDTQKHAYEYSVEDYLNKIINSEDSTYESIKALADSMKKYGDAAIKYFK